MFAGQTMMNLHHQAMTTCSCKPDYLIRVQQNYRKQLKSSHGHQQNETFNFGDQNSLKFTAAVCMQCMLINAHIVNMSAGVFKL